MAKQARSGIARAENLRFLWIKPCRPMKDTCKALSKAFSEAERELAGHNYPARAATGLKGGTPF